MLILLVVVTYFLIGALALFLFDRVTKRLRKGLDIATVETQTKMAEAGNPMQTKTARVFFLGLMWLFWPLVFVGVFEKEKGDNVSGTCK